MFSNSLPCYVVIVAGGQGLRMGNALPKQFLNLNGKPILYHTIKAFHEALPSAKILAVLPASHLSYMQLILREFDDMIDIEIVSGGETRYHSVQNALKLIEEESIIMVHDGVRPFPSSILIQRCYKTCLEKGSAVPAVPISDSIRELGENNSSKIIDRTKLRAIQTPQTFHSAIIVPSFNKPYQEMFTDEASVVENDGHSIVLIEGEQLNIKITTPEDLILASAIMFR